MSGGKLNVNKDSCAEFFRKQQEAGFGTSETTGSVSFSIEEIKHYLEGFCLVGEHKENDMLNCAISLLEDDEDGIEAVLERRKTNVPHDSCWN